jgi:ribosomal protein L21E
MPDGFYHLANGKVIDKQGKAVDISDISELQMKDAYDTNLDNRNEDAEYFRS